MFIRRAVAMTTTAGTGASLGVAVCTVAGFVVAGPAGAAIGWAAGAALGGASGAVGGAKVGGRIADALDDASARRLP